MPRAPRATTVGLLLRSPWGHAGGYPYVARNSIAKPRWSVIIRRSSGTFGKDEVVATFPADRPTTGRKVDIAGQPGRVTFGTVTWKLASPYATLRGDLPTDELIDIARNITIRNGRPVLATPGALGLTVAATVPYTAQSTHEARYDATRLGVAGRALGGLVFTGVAQTAEVDDWALLAHPSFEGQVRGSPAVVTSLFGGNGALAWELRPGTIAYVGYSGAELSERTSQALLCLAQWSRPVTAPQWRAAVARAPSSGP